MSQPRQGTLWGWIGAFFLAIGLAGCDSGTVANPLLANAVKVPTGSLTAGLDLESYRRECSELVWAMSNTTTVSIEPNIGMVSANGSTKVCVEEVTTYTLTASGPEGSLDPPLSIRVPVSAFQGATITVDPSVVDLGECSTVTWATNLSSAWLAGYGSDRDFWILEPLGIWVPASGSTEVCPERSMRLDLSSGFPGLGPEFSATRGGVTLEVSYADRATARCDGVTVTAGPPRRLESQYSLEHPGGCPVGYAIDISLQAEATRETMIADFLRPYTVADWQVRRSGDRVRHDFTLYWNPFSDSIQRKSSYREIVPMVVHPCPEQRAGPILACSDLSCAEYEDESAIPSLRPSPIDVVLRVPWDWSTPVEVQQGSSLEVPVLYEIYRPLERELPLRPSTALISGQPPSRSGKLLLIEPEERFVPKGVTGSGTLYFHMTPLPADDGQTESVHYIRISDIFSGCPVAQPNIIRMLVTK